MINSSEKAPLRYLNIWGQLRRIPGKKENGFLN
jgi:hypothetical protein